MRGEAMNQDWAVVTVATAASRWRPTEIRLESAAQGIPFEVELTARVTLDGGREITVGGFYDGDGTWILRYLPDEPGVCGASSRRRRRRSGRPERRGRGGRRAARRPRAGAGRVLSATWNAG
jgi:hypothetical protein